MLNIRTDRLANWLLYLAVLLGVIGTTAHAETGYAHPRVDSSVARRCRSVRCGRNQTAADSARFVEVGA